MIEYQQFKDILPQFYPMCMIDRIVEFKKGESLIAIKNITANEWLFEGQLHSRNMFPETLLIEAAAQAALVLYGMSEMISNLKDSRFILGHVNAEFKDSILIGEQLKINTYATKMLRNFGYMDIHLENDFRDIADVQVFYKVVNNYNEKL